MQFKMNFKNDGLTVGELSIAIATLLIVGFIWTSLTKSNEKQEVSMLINNSAKLSHPKQS